MRRSEVEFQKTDVIEKDTEYNVSENGNVNACGDIPGLNRGKHCQINNVQNYFDDDVQ